VIPGPKLNLRSFFPFPESIRPVQVEALEKIEQAYRSGKRFVLIEAPTGSGKSPIAVAVARALGGYILTPQKMLTQQYLDDFSDLDLTQLRGRSNYTCYEYGADCQTGAELREREPEEKRKELCKLCPYRSAKEAFMSAQVGITNFDYFLLERMFAGELPARAALILDEGHNAEDLILKHVSLTFDCGWAQRQLGVVVPEIIPGKNGPAVVEWMQNELLLAAQQHAGLCEGALSAEPGNGQLQTLAANARDFVRKVEYLLRQSDLEEWLFWTEDRGLFTKEKFCARPLSAAPFAERMLFSAASEMVLILSATILDSAAFQEALGIPATNCVTLQLPSEFPVENRPIYFVPAGSMRRRDRDTTLPRLLELVLTILRRHSADKRIIHAHSFSNCKAVIDFLLTTEHSTRILTHKTAMEKEEILNHHAREKNIPTVLISPSMSEGLDLRDELSRFQVIVKIPYGDLGNPYVVARKHHSKRWYLWQTALRLVQATGRSVRSKEDRAETYVLDSDFRSFVFEAKHILPKWWTDAINWNPRKDKPTLSTVSTSENLTKNIGNV
jgi:Rad3-related DNA helicase